ASGFELDGHTTSTVRTEFSNFRAVDFPLDHIRVRIVLAQ
ncbi:MAG: hypothetical protein ACI89J_000921, partial [Hyphomicrobiaceae bacterium]